MDKIGCYYRVSSLKQEDDGKSIDVQRKLGIETSKKLGYEYVEYNEGGKSSFSSEINLRPQLVKLLDDISKGKIKKIWVYNTDRLGRTSQSWYTILKVLIQYNVEIYTGDSTKPYNLKNPVDKLTITILTSISQYDNELRRIRSIMGKIESLKQGNTWVGGTVPFGYQVKNKMLVLQKEESKLVRKMFEMYRDGKSTTDIKMLLDKSPFNPRRSEKGWNLGTIQMMLRKESYKGTQVWEFKETDPNGEVTIIDKVTVKTPRIIEDKLWVEVRKKVDDLIQRKGINNSTKHNSLLRGLLICKKCGLSLGQRYRNTNHYYGRCKEVNWKNKVDDFDNNCGLSKSIRVEETNELIWNLFIDVLKNSKKIREEYKIKGLTPKYDKETDRKKKLKTMMKYRSDLIRVLSKTKEELINIEVEFRLGDLNKNMYDGIKSKFTERIKTQEIDLQKYDIKIEDYRNSESWINWVEQLNKSLDRKNNFTLEKKKEELFRTIENIMVSYNKDKRGHDFNVNFKIPIVGDRIDYVDKKDKSKGYKIVEGDPRFNVSMKQVTSKTNFKEPNKRTKIIETIFELKDKEDFSFQKISDLLNEKGMKTVRGKKWTKPSVNRVYLYNKSTIENSGK